MAGAVSSRAGSGRAQAVLEMNQRGRRKRRPLDREADRRLEAIADIIEPLARSLGEHCEIVLHDYRVPDRSVVAVAGKVTERRAGSAMSEIGLSVLAEGRAAQDRLNYLAKAPNGRVINSSTIVLRDANRRVFGALCINLDVTELRHAARILNALIGRDVKPERTTFADDIRDVIDASLRDELDGRSVTTLSRSDRLEIVRALDARGVFNVKRAVGQVAAVLGVSRATVYACLQAIRQEAVGGARAAGPRRGGPSAVDRTR
jgi:predicted transcriptional regulator YheO